MPSFLNLYISVLPLLFFIDSFLFLYLNSFVPRPPSPNGNHRPLFILSLSRLICSIASDTASSLLLCLLPQTHARVLTSLAYCHVASLHVWSWTSHARFHLKTASFSWSVVIGSCLFFHYAKAATWCCWLFLQNCSYTQTFLLYSYYWCSGFRSLSYFIFQQSQIDFLCSELNSCLNLSCRWRYLKCMSISLSYLKYISGFLSCVA